MIGNTLKHLGRRYASTGSSGLKLGVVGSGQMGAGIVQVASHVAGMQVVMMDSDGARAEKAKAGIQKQLARMVEKGKTTGTDADAALARIQTAASLEALASCDVVVEAATENMDIKRSIFERLSQVTGPNAILASNTSSISITKIASFTKRPTHVVGMHFMNPVPVMQLVEVIPGVATSDATLQTTLAMAKDMGKTTALSDDRPGFIANRLLMPYINEAILALQDGVGTKDAIDTTMKLGTNMPMGPLALADLIGLDTCLAIMNVLHRDFGDSKYRPATLLAKYVDAGWLGRKSGRGFYEY